MKFFINIFTNSYLIYMEKNDLKYQLCTTQTRIVISKELLKNY